MPTILPLILCCTSNITAPVEEIESASLSDRTGDTCIATRSSVTTSQIKFCSTSTPGCKGECLNLFSTYGGHTA